MTEIWSAEWEFENPPSPVIAAWTLRNIIPDDPNYSRHVPFYYMIDARAVSGNIAYDLSTGESIHKWLEGIDLGIAAAEIFELIAEASLLAVTLSVASPFIGTLAILGTVASGFQEATVDVADKECASAFSHGVVMGAEARKGSVVMDYFGNYIWSGQPEYASVAKANHGIGLFAGWVNGRLLSPNQRAIFWRDLGFRGPDAAWRGDQKTWNRAGWIDWYTEVGATFRRFHLNH